MAAYLLDMKEKMSTVIAFAASSLGLGPSPGSDPGGPGRILFDLRRGPHLGSRWLGVWCWRLKLPQPTGGSKDLGPCSLPLFQDSASQFRWPSISSRNGQIPAREIERL
jgi:hypothetical protein